MNIKKTANLLLNFTIKRLAEIFGILISLAGGLLLLALITYSPNDPNFIFPENVKIENINIICLYLPNGNPAPGPKYNYKINWMRRLVKYTQIIYDTNEPLILGGDFNVIQQKIDCHDVSKWLDDALYLDETRSRMKELINVGLIDSYRLKHPNLTEYSFWDYQAGAWQKDNGIRIDFLLISPEIVDILIDVGIDKNLRGQEKPSDHTPVWIEIEKKY